MSAVTTMRALVLRQHGGLDNLEVVTHYPMPSATEGHVVMRVGASSFNYHDVFTVRGMPGIKVPLPVIIGLDMAGEVVEVGQGVSGWRSGERVLVNPVNKHKGLMGEMLDGGMAEYCRVAAEQLLRMPDTVTFEEAASLPVAYGTAHRMLITHNTVKPGDKVVILGASGGVGTGCVILCKRLRAEVIACASSAKKLQRLKELGADHGLNYQEVDFSQWVIDTYGKPQRRLRRGDVGIIVTWRIREEQYDVEFNATAERGTTLVTLREDQLLQLNPSREELSPYAPLAEHWQEVRERQPPESGSEREEATSLIRVPDNIKLHDLPHLVCMHRPTDFAPYGIRQRAAADCSCGCKHYVTLAGDLGADWGVCANPRSPRAGLLTFEHQGCEFFAYDERTDEEIEPYHRDGGKQP